MGLYQLAVQENFPQYDTIEGAQYFLRLGEEVRHRMTPDEIDALIEGVRVAVLATLQAEKMDDFPTVEGSLCNWCEYFHLCPAKRHKALLEKEETDNRPAAVQAQEKATEYLTLYARQKELKAELDALKNDLIELARDLDVNKIEAEGGQVSITLRQEEKFITKTDDERGFADLTNYVRGLGLDDYFKLDGNALMKDIYRTKRLEPSQMEQLSEWVRVKDASRVSVKFDKPDPDKSDA